MFKKLLLVVLSLLIIGILPVHAERTYFFQCGDITLWEPVEETYIEGQQEKEQGPIRVSRGIGIGWFKPGNAVEILETVDFGDGIINMSAKVAAQYPEDHFEVNMPDARFEIRIDSHDGPIIAYVKPVGTTSWEIMEDAEVEITGEGKNVKGEHTIFIVNRIGTPEEYLEGTLKGSCNFNELEIVTNAEEPTPKPTPTPTETPEKTPVLSQTPEKTPTTDRSTSSPYLIPRIIGTVVVLGAAVIVQLVRKRGK
ncbi:MAG: hypothetical protein GX166_11480 [Clostridiaceae bacterium]|nr:hypothetical protein [Clostridiaceae bacterium]